MDIFTLVLLGLLVVGVLGISGSLRRIAELNGRYVEGDVGTSLQPGSKIYISAFGVDQRCTVLGTDENGVLVVSPEGSPFGTEPDEAL